ncbi:MAG: hypothetical protein A2Y34_14700 [Spirochaetes bacterium GWC1_27_15]|nr:MAG: hypothetical protein A2Z98_16425 [Spirochaetes bacterium GWB1_27_13]OHD27920.1 MAG: hypothetical protein A2Y34_14700 [Spirochaetes bacterium GWC1_27_15]
MNKKVVILMAIVFSFIVFYSCAKKEAPTTTTTTTIEVEVQEPKVSTPTFSPAPGEYKDEQSISLSCETTDAKIKYTTDGTTPNENSLQYRGIPIKVSSVMKIKAIAIKEGLENSDVAEGNYTIKKEEIKGVKNVDGKKHFIRWGENLWSICKKYYNDPWYYPALFEANPTLKSPRKIYAGTYLIVPDKSSLKRWDFKK